MPSIAQLKKGQSDPTLKEGGVWFELVVPDVIEPLKLKMRSAASDTVRLWEIRKFREQRNYYLNDNIPPLAVIDQTEADKLAEVVVMEWNVTAEDGTPESCTVEAVRALMLQLSDTRRDALAEIAKHNRFRKTEVIAITKNSERPLSQGSATVAEGV